MVKAQHFAEEALRVAERLDDAARLVRAHMALGSSLFWQGKFVPALAHLRRGFEIFDPKMEFPDWPGSHPGVQCQFFPDADLLVARVPGSVPRRTGGSGKRCREARALVDPRPNAVLRGPRSHLSPRAIGG